MYPIRTRKLEEFEVFEFDVKCKRGFHLIVVTNGDWIRLFVYQPLHELRHETFYIESNELVYHAQVSKWLNEYGTIRQQSNELIDGWYGQISRMESDFADWALWRNGE